MNNNSKLTSITEQISHWQLQISDPQRSYKSTKDVHVLASEMIDAVKRVSELYPNARIFNCIHKGTFDGDLYVRPKILLDRDMT